MPLTQIQQMELDSLKIELGTLEEVIDIDEEYTTRRRKSLRTRLESLKSRISNIEDAADDNPEP